MLGMGKTDRLLPAPLSGIWRCKKRPREKVTCSLVLSSRCIPVSAVGLGLSRCKGCMAGWLEGAAPSKFFRIQFFHPYPGHAGTRHNKLDANGALLSISSGL